MTSEREARYAEAMGWRLDEAPGAIRAMSREQVQRVMAVADEEQAELRAEVERLEAEKRELAMTSLTQQTEWFEEHELRAEAEQKLEALVADLRGLADAWERRLAGARQRANTNGDFEAIANVESERRLSAASLRAVLDKHAGDSSKASRLNCPVCGSGEFGDCVCHTRTRRCICNDPPVAREVICALHPTAHLDKHAGEQP